jgi:hypothetical protein
MDLLRYKDINVCQEKEGIVEIQTYTHSQNGNVKMFRVKPGVSCSGVVKMKELKM